MKNLILMTLVALLPTSAHAAVLKGGELLSIDERIQDDLYIAGGQVSLESTVDGDITAAAGEITISGSSKQDVIAAGGRMNVSGDVGDDARIAGGQIRVSGTIRDDLIVAAGEFESTETTTVLGDAKIFGGEVFVDGTYSGKTHIVGGRVVIRGVIDGPLHVEAEDVTIFGEVQGKSVIRAHKITISSSAKFFEEVRYWQPKKDVTFGASLQDTSAVYDESLAREHKEKKHHKKDFGHHLGDIIVSTLFAAFFIIIVGLVLDKRHIFDDAAKYMRARPGLSAFKGLLYFSIVPIISILLLITVVGIPFSLLMGVLYAFSIYFSLFVAAMILAKCIKQEYNEEWSVWMFIGVSIAMFVVIKIFALVPIIGWLSVLFLVCASYGSLIGSHFTQLKQKVKKKTPARKKKA